MLAEAQWLYAPAELQATPSVRDGMALEKERELRLKGTNFILQVGIALKLPQLTLSTAAVFFNRFLMRRSLVAKGGVKPLHHYVRAYAFSTSTTERRSFCFSAAISSNSWQEIAATSIFLATKVEETCRKMKEIVIACCRVAQKNPTLLVDEQTKDFWRWRDTILLNEDVLLETICFDLTVESPHKILYDMLKQLGAAHAKPLRSAAWSFLNDSTTTQLCLLFPSRAIAAAALYCAAKHCSFAFPDDKVGRPWWEVMHVSLRDIKRACNYMADVYIERRGSGSTVGTSAVSGDSTNVGDGSGASEGNAGGDGSGRNSIYVGLHTPEDGDNRSTKTRQQRQRSSSPTGTNSGCAKRARDDEGGDEDGEVVVKRDRHAENNESKGYNDHDGKTADKPTRRHSLGPDRDKDKDIDRDGNWNGDQDNQIRGRARPSEHDANDDERHRKRQRTASTSAGGISLPDNERAADGRGGEWPESGGVSISGAGAGAGAGAGTGDAATSMKDEEEVGSEDGEVEG